MRLLVIADIEDLNWKHGTGEADILLSCGDVFDHVILEAADAFKCHAIFAVKGNHDSANPFPEPIVDLHRFRKNCMGVTFGGLNGAWKYKPRGHYLYEQSEVEGYLSIFPGTDIFISHNSPRGIHDRNDAIHTGFDGLTSYIARAKPKILVHGHNHVNKESTFGETRVIGVHGWRQVQFFRRPLTSVNAQVNLPAWARLSVSIGPRTGKPRSRISWTHSQGRLPRRFCGS